MEQKISLHKPLHMGGGYSPESRQGDRHYLQQFRRRGQMEPQEQAGGEGWSGMVSGTILMKSVYSVAQEGSGISL